MSKLLEVIDPRFDLNDQSSKVSENVDLTVSCIVPSQLPDFLGGSCSCDVEGGCLRSNKGPWNDPEIMKVLNEAVHFFSRLIPVCWIILKYLVLDCV